MSAFWMQKAYNLKQFSREANESETAELTATEQAFVDSDKLDAATMKDFVAGEDGTIHLAANRKFITKFLSKYSDAERRPLSLDDGSISEEGIERVRNALLAKTFGTEKALIERMIASPDNNIKRITNALLKTAPKFADLKQKISEGLRVEGLDISDDIARAVNKFAELRADGVSVKEYLQQQNLFAEDELTPFQKSLVEFFDKYSNSAKAIAEVFDDYLDVAEQFGNPALHFYSKKAE